MTATYRAFETNGYYDYDYDYDYDYEYDYDAASRLGYLNHDAAGTANDQTFG